MVHNAIQTSAHTHEKTYAVIHRHWFNVLKQFIPLKLFFFGLILASLFARTIADSIGAPEILPLAYFILSGLAIFIWVSAILVWVDYHLDIWIVTSSRVLNIEQKGLFSRTISELDYTHVQDVTSEVHGPIKTLLNYGDVDVQTAGTHGKFTFRNIPRPEKIKTLVMHLHRQAITKQAHPTNIQRDYPQKPTSNVEGL